MLENEPDNDNTPTADDQAGATTTPPPRRRRAASRPAGPPAPVPVATAPETPVVEQVPAVAQLDAPPLAPPAVGTQAEVPAPPVETPNAVAPRSAPQVEVSASEVTEISGSEAPPAKKAAAKRAPRKSAAKKVAAVPPPEAAPADPQLADAQPVDAQPADAQPAEVGEHDSVSVEPPKKRAPRKRATKKAAAPEPGLAAIESDAAATLAAAAAPSAGVTPPSTEVTPAAGSTPEGPAGWVAPAAEAAPATEPAPLEVDDELVPPAEPGDDPANAPVSTEQPRDFGWLADPFAVPPAPEPTPAAGDAEAEHLDTAVAETATGADDGAAEGAAGTSSPDETAPTGPTAEDDESGDGGNRRRRRRRGGRRRRRGASGDDDLDSDDESDGDTASAADPHAAEQSSPATGGTAQSPADTPVPGRADSTERIEDATDDGGDENDGEDSEGQRRRRRRRRRRGEEAAAAPDDPTDVLVRVREPRSRKKTASTEVTGIEGSTRMEAKRQRRKEGRDAGRRRAPILSEAEFLARRESVDRKMIIRQREDPSAGSGESLAQIAVLEDGILVEHYVDRDSAASLIGNVYLGRVQNVLPSMEAAFVDIGRGRNAVLYAGEVDWDSFGAEGHNRKVEKVLKSGQMILVQVSKDPVGAKGARLTNHVSIPGRYVVYAPGGHLSGISRKLPDVERRRLKDILADLVGESASVIVRTAAEGASEDELVRDVNRLKAQWEDIERKVKAGNSPQLLYGEPDLTVRIVRDLFTEDFSELIIQGNNTMNDAYDAIQGYVTHVAPHLQERIRRWEPTGEQDLFAEYRLDEQIAKALERKVFLPSGGSLVIDRTEAMTVIDVNTGKFTGTGGNLEATVTSNNLEAAEEIVNQLRLRDIGGIIVIDFIDMVLPSNRELLLRRLVECLGRDRTRHQVAEVTSLGLVQMTRKKIGTGLLEAFGTECPHCLGRGFLLHDAPVDTQKQADGGARESRGANHRPRPGDGQRGPRPGGGREPGASRESNGSRDNGSRDNGSRETEPVAVGVGGSTPSDSGDEQPDRGRSRRGRRGGRGASGGRDLDEPDTDQADDRAEPASVPPDSADVTSRPEESGRQDAGQQESVQQESNRAYYDERERASEQNQADPLPSEQAQADPVPSEQAQPDPVPSVDLTPGASDASSSDEEHQNDA